MNPADVVIVAVVVVLVALCVRLIARDVKGEECVGCSQGGSCSAHEHGEACPASEDLVARAEAAAAAFERDCKGAAR